MFLSLQGQCNLLREYLHSVLGEYVAALQAGVMNCSKRLCNSQGRCARQDAHSGYMIPLHDSYRADVLSDMRTKFKCVCYKGWSGQECENQERAN